MVVSEAPIACVMVERKEEQAPFRNKSCQKFNKRLSHAPVRCLFMAEGQIPCSIESRLATMRLRQPQELEVLIMKKVSPKTKVSDRMKSKNKR